MSGTPHVVCVTVSATMSGLCPSTYLLQPVVSLNACIGYNNVAILCVKCNTTSVVFPLFYEGFRNIFLRSFAPSAAICLFQFLAGWGVLQQICTMYTHVYIYIYIYICMHIRIYLHKYIQHIS